LQLAEAMGGLKFHNGGVIDVKGRHVMWLLACSYALIGLATTSTFIWACGMLTMGIWVAYWVPSSGTIDVLRGDYPIRFVILGGILTSTACCMSMHPRTSHFWSSTRIWGLTYLFLFGLWYGSALNTLYGDWRTARLWIALLWTLALTAAAGTSTWYGLKYDDAVTRSFGLVFLALDIYTRYWDFFWGSMYRPLFFAVLAASLALAGWGAEQMWRTRVERLPR